jgi:signal transduction histidine kinase/ActR/RegA family two-component response regulator
VVDAKDAVAQPGRDQSIDPRMAELVRVNERLREEVRQLHVNGQELRGQLQVAVVGSLADRDSRRAALNLMEDAVHARRQTLTVNEQLQHRISEHERAEANLVRSQDELKRAEERLRILSDEFDARVLERTQELREREARLRTLATQIKRVEHKERQRLAHLLHDRVQQLLVAAKMRVDFVSLELDEGPKGELQAAVDVLSDAIQATRDLSVQLTPPLLHDQGLPAALQWLLSRTRQQHGLTIHEKIEEANPASEEMRELLFQAAQELLLNSVKHSGVKKVTVRLERQRDEYRLTVKDRGRGFDPVTGREIRGSFGLFQIRQRLEALGGELRIESRPGAGVTATAVLSVTEAISESLNDGKRSRAGSAATLMRERSELVTVVLIDDHQIVREGLAQLLNRQPDIKVVGEAANGADGVQLVLECRPTVVVMDVNMPHLNGIETTRRILQRLPDIQVIGLSLESIPEMSGSMLAAGAKRYLTKDNAAGELVDAIREVTRRKSSP